jgi:hypothetical protein
VTRYHPTAFPYTCANCSRSYSEAEWSSLVYVGEMGASVGAPLELRNCSCGGTMGARLEGWVDDETWQAERNCPPTLRTGCAPICSVCRRPVAEQAPGYTGPLCTGCAETFARFGCE